jgi:hypothetical protein
LPPEPDGPEEYGFKRREAIMNNNLIRRMNRHNRIAYERNVRYRNALVLYAIAFGLPILLSLAWILVSGFVYGCASLLFGTSIPLFLSVCILVHLWLGRLDPNDERDRVRLRIGDRK